jgi:LCP family protein required for cell wall assembly
MVPLTLLTVLLVAIGIVGYRVESLMTTVHSVSTPPPVVTDGTFMDTADPDPDEPAAPITVDTGPAVAALETAEGSAGSGGGFTNRIQQAASNSTDLLGGAAIAAGLRDEERGRPLTFLFMGVDARPGAAIDIGVRPDMLMLVRLEPQTRTCRLLAIPRDTRVELPGYGESKINHALMVGGIPYQIMVTESFLDIEIDHYVLIDFVAFQQLVDSLGGITVHVPEDLVKNGEVRFEAGEQHFDGEQALAYTRFRDSSDGDIGRIERRWDLLAGLANAAQGRDLVAESNRLLPTLKDHLRTDLSATDITEIARQYGTGCTSASARSSQSINVLSGSRVRLSDPILGQTAYFNVVGESTVQDAVEVFMAPGSSNPPSTPMATPVATPVASSWRGKSGPLRPLQTA